MSKRRKGLNSQGLSRKDSGLMNCILPEPGNTVVSVDLSAGEPSVTSHFTQDENYRYACFDGIGKSPQIRGGVLFIDDLYLMVASISPIGQKVIEGAYKSVAWAAGDFKAQWAADPEVVKKELKSTRQFHKMACLADDAMVQIKNKGFLPISDVRPGDLVWDGAAWVETQGAVYSGLREVMPFKGTHVTPDHRILDHHEQWRRADQVASLSSSQPGPTNWSEVWYMVRSLVRDSAVWGVPLYLCRLWTRAAMEALR